MSNKTVNETLDFVAEFKSGDDFTYYENLLRSGYFAASRIALMAVSTVELRVETLSKEPVLSVEETGVACRICGEKRNTLKRHLRASHGLEEDDYKDMFPDAKTVSESYSSLRSQVAVTMKLGH